jgi:S-adenosylmethionine hydrolase
MPFGNVVTNIPRSLVDAMDLSPQDNHDVFVTISQAGKPVFQQRIPYAKSFGHVDEGAALLYSDSLQMIGLAVNSGNFAQQFKIRAGAEWRIRIAK